MKIFKNPIFTFIIGAIIFSSITAIAVTQINANQVSYTDSNNREIKLDKALDEVYANLDTKKVLNSFGTTQYATSQGSKIAPRNVSLQLTKGKYIVFDYKGHNWRTTATTYQSTFGAIENASTSYKNLACESNSCIINDISGYANMIMPAKDSSNYYNQLIVEAFVYYVEIKEVIDTLSASENAGGADNYMSQFDTLIAIPIN